MEELHCSPNLPLLGGGRGGGAGRGGGGRADSLYEELPFCVRSRGTLEPL